MLFGRGPAGFEPRTQDAVPGLSRPFVFRSPNTSKVFRQLLPRNQSYLLANRRKTGIGQIDIAYHRFGNIFI